MMKNRITESKRIVVKVGTSTLTHQSGKMNIRHIEALCKVLSDLQNAGREIILVSSGAIGVGIGNWVCPAGPTTPPRSRLWLQSGNAS